MDVALDDRPQDGLLSRGQLHATNCGDCLVDALLSAEVVGEPIALLVGLLAALERLPVGLLVARLRLLLGLIDQAELLLAARD